MTTEEFINKWRWQKDPDGSEMVGIVINWDKIPNYAPPWHYEGGEIRPFSHWVGSKSYLEEIERERKAGKLSYYDEHGLEYPFFCVFANADGSKGIVGDANHRFINCRYLIDYQSKDLKNDIARCTLDILCLENLKEVIQDTVYPNY